jgi:hypothetical protein
LQLGRRRLTDLGTVSAIEYDRPAHRQVFRPFCIVVDVVTDCAHDQSIIGIESVALASVDNNRRRYGAKLSVEFFC